MRDVRVKQRDQTSDLHLKRRLKQLWWGTRRPTSRLRALPDFIIIGAQKAGTTSLYKYLCAHPEVKRPFGQEPEFFSNERLFRNGIDFYRTNFPLAPTLKRPWRPRITGEATGEYLYHPQGPDRIASALPNTKLIVALRDPTERAVSQYFHNRKYGIEDRPFERAITDEIDRHAQDVSPVEQPYRRFGPWGSRDSYLGRSMYAHHLAPWYSAFSEHQICVVDTGRLSTEPRHALTEVTQFLDIDAFPEGFEFDTYNEGAKRNLDDDLVRWVRGLFDQPNLDLQSLLDAACESAPRISWLHG